MGKDSHFYSPLFIHRKFKECFKAKPNASKNLFFFLILKTITFLNRGLHFHLHHVPGDLLDPVIQPVFTQQTVICSS